MAEPQQAPKLLRYDLGQVAEMRAIVALLERGHKVAVPVVDEIVDLIVDHRITVQVRSASPLARAAEQGAQQFTFKTEGSDLEHLDVFMFYAHGPQVWWLVPAEELRRWPAVVGRRAHVTRVSVTLDRSHPGGRRTVLDRWREAWHVLDR